jgi:hypothetical protein
MLSEDELAALEGAVVRALETGDVSHLEVVGYGEITTVVQWQGESDRLACKRLPGLADEAAFTAYRDCVARYVERLAEAGVRVPKTSVERVVHPGGSLTAYCVQPVLPREALLPRYLARCGAQEAVAVFERILDRVRSAIDGRIGLDAQLSNWAWTGEELWYFDISTPFERDEAGRELFDVELHLASVPWALRGLVRFAFLDTILDKFYEVRGTLVDLLGNMYKERLDRLVPAFAEVANRAVTPPITVAEADRYYRGDARLWTLLQALRRIDRWWQRRVRRRPYPFLLPGKIER